MKCPSCNALGHYNIGATVTDDDGVRVKVLEGPFYSKDSADKHALAMEKDGVAYVTIIIGKSSSGEALYYVCKEI